MFSAVSMMNHILFTIGIDGAEIHIYISYIIVTTSTPIIIRMRNVPCAGCIPILYNRVLMGISFILCFGSNILCHSRISSAVMVVM